MHYFLTPEKYLPENVGFKLYGPEHLAWSAVIILMIWAMVHFYKRMDAEARRKFAKTVAVILVASEILRDAMLIGMDAWYWRYLPLHPCSFTMFILAIWAFKPNKFCGNLLYGFGMAGAACALLFCNWTEQPPLQFQSIHSWVFHGILVGFVLMTVIGGDIVPDSKGIIHNIVFLIPAASFASVFNFLLPDCNFFFTHTGSEGSPLEIFVNVFGQPWWILAYIALAGVVVCIEFIPWILKEKKEERTPALQSAAK